MQNEKIKQRKKVCGVYRLEHVTTGWYYIGGSVDVASRFNSHLWSIRHDKYNQHINRWKGVGRKKFTELYLEDGCSTENFTYTVVVECTEKELTTMEEFVLGNSVGTDPLCLNYRKDATRGGRIYTDVQRDQQAQCRVGKGLRRIDTPRSPVVSLRAPDGTEHSGIVNINQFSKDHGLTQSGLNDMVNGNRRHHKGWTVIKEAAVA